ncbi:uncharacterized protein C17orf67 homolog isoform X2 [Cervus elaphus]|uniref:uncharacterized protein C17orf67 homolog isoform X2 n=1 Tax=Cervus elaphus TaxID=9860 RepID=UPI001CC2EC25|nr:uncharacterized protein C17orf67 homolog isoform X2 [Cervus elaphus]
MAPPCHGNLEMDRTEVYEDIMLEVSRSSGVHAPSAPPGTPCRGAVPGALAEPTLQTPLRQEPGPSHLRGSGPASGALMSKGLDTIETR